MQVLGLIVHFLSISHGLYLVLDKSVGEKNQSSTCQNHVCYKRRKDATPSAHAAVMLKTIDSRMLNLRMTVNGVSSSSAWSTLVIVRLCGLS